jgi:hypothetical protein
MATLITVNVQCDLATITGRAFTERPAGVPFRLCQGSGLLLPGPRLSWRPLLSASTAPNAPSPTAIPPLRFSSAGQRNGLSSGKAEAGEGSGSGYTGVDRRFENQRTRKPFPQVASNLN